MEHANPYPDSFSCRASRLGYLGTFDSSFVGLGGGVKLFTDSSMVNIYGRSCALYVYIGYYPRADRWAGTNQIINSN